MHGKNIDLQIYGNKINLLPKIGNEAERLAPTIKKQILMEEPRKAPSSHLKTDYLWKKGKKEAKASTMARKPMNVEPQE